MQIVLASHNPGKIKELQLVLSPLGFAIESAPALGLTEPPEPYTTFLENALAKARHVARLTGKPALADDSGLCVAALGGAPGVHSARYAGARATDSENNAKLLQAMQKISHRAAYYYGILILLRHSDDPQPLLAEGFWQGAILETPRGTNGFGYDPIFLDTASGLSAAEMPLEQKLAASHRGQACRSLVEQIRCLGMGKEL